MKALKAIRLPDYNEFLFETDVDKIVAILE